MTAEAGLRGPGAIALLVELRDDLRRMRAQRMPMIVLFSRSDCRYCEQVRINYLRPLARDDRAVLVREVVSDYSKEPIHADLETTHAAFSEQFKVRFFPTVLFLDSTLASLADPLVGADKAGFYGGYLDARVAQAKAALAR